MRRQRLSIKIIIYALVAGVFIPTPAFATNGIEHIHFKVSVSPALASEPMSGRLLIFMTSKTKPLEMIEPDFLDPRSVFISGVEVHNLGSDKAIEVDPDALAFPAAFSSAPAGDYQVMALLDVDHS